MTFSELLIEKKYTTYKLSKKSGVALTTIFDIESGKSNILDCRGRVLLKISQALDTTIEYLLALDQEPYNKPYEENLPLFLDEGIRKLKKYKKKKNYMYDMFLDEVNSSINVSEVENLISKEQASYLRKKYLEGR